MPLLLFRRSGFYDLSELTDSPQFSGRAGGAWTSDSTLDCGVDIWFFLFGALPSTRLRFAGQMIDLCPRSYHPDPIRNSSFRSAGAGLVPETNGRGDGAGEFLPDSFGGQRVRESSEAAAPPLSRGLRPSPGGTVT